MSIARDNATLKGTYEYLNRDSKIEFKCICGKDDIKPFRNLVKFGGAFCKSCVYKNRKPKIVKTSLEKYGSICPLQNRAIQEQTKKTNLSKYGVEHPCKNKTIMKKIENTCIERYGHKSHFQNEDIKTKIKNTNKEKYGCEYIAQYEPFKKKMQNTLKANYGVEHPLHNDKLKQKAVDTCLKNHGCMYPTQNQVIRDKIKKSFLNKYGCEYGLQSIEIYKRLTKSSFSYKDYTLKSGKICKVQGYEPYALDELFETYLEDDICINVEDKPKIEYLNGTQKHYYFPDIYIPKENKLIEVKSAWTYLCDPDIIKLKGKACKEKGYLYEIWIYDNKKNKTVEVF